MKNTSLCQPWCDEHSNGFCHTVRFLLSEDHQEQLEVDHRIQSIIDEPPSVDTMLVEATYMHDGDEETEITLKMWDSNYDDDAARLITTLPRIRQLYIAMGSFLDEAEGGR